MNSPDENPFQEKLFDTQNEKKEHRCLETKEVWKNQIYYTDEAIWESKWEEERDG